MVHYISSINKAVSVKDHSIISCSAFFGLNNGAIYSRTLITIQTSYCAFEEVTKNGYGACIEAQSPYNVSVEKSYAKCCGTHTETEETAVGHFLYMNTNSYDLGLILKEVSYCNSIVNDLNITNSYTTHYSVVFRQYVETKLSRILFHDIETNYHFISCEMGKVFGNKFIFSNISIGNRLLIYLNEDEMTLTDCCVNVTSYDINLINNSSLVFQNCYFRDMMPNFNGVDIIGTNTPFEDSEGEIIGAGVVIDRIMMHHIVSSKNTHRIDIIMATLSLIYL